MNCRITVLPENRILSVESGTTLLKALRAAGLSPDAPCGGAGTCGKCLVRVDDELVYACRTIVDHDFTVERIIPRETAAYEPACGSAAASRSDSSSALVSGSGSSSDSASLSNLSFAVDLGTTTVVVFLLNEHGEVLSSASAINAQTAYGADVVTRIQAAIKGDAKELSTCIRKQLQELMEECLRAVEIRQAGTDFHPLVKTIALVGNPAMQQLFLEIPVNNLAAVPFEAVLRGSDFSMRRPAAPYIPAFPNAELLTVPDIAGFVGADTVGCILSLGLHKSEKIVLMIDVGTNGEIVLGNRDRLLSTATAAGPALEGANISCGMRASKGAIDHVYVRKEEKREPSETARDEEKPELSETAVGSCGDISCHTIGDGPATGICGSGLIDAVAACLDAGLLNTRGRILPAADPEQKEIRLAEKVSLTQKDIRELQLSKGAIAAGIELLLKHYGITCDEVSEVLLAGAFGSFLNPENALKIGLLPAGLAGKIRAVGNAAGEGAKLLAETPSLLSEAAEIAAKTDFLELSTDPDFQLTFAMNMYFNEKPEFE